MSNWNQFPEKFSIHNFTNMWHFCMAPCSITLFAMDHCFVTHTSAFFCVANVKFDVCHTCMHDPYTSCQAWMILAATHGTYSMSAIEITKFIVATCSRAGIKL